MSEQRSIEEILTESHTIAVVGASSNSEKAAHRIPLALQGMGFRIIPVNPHADELFGEVVHRSLSTITERIDIVDVFRPSAETADVARQAVAAGARVVWLQLGITSSQAREVAVSAGLDYVEDRCLMVEAAKRLPAG
jgi:predicted CoA-binding protein